jgi:DNA-binding LacI/PurR family transcriptional regulator
LKFFPCYPIISLEYLSKISKALKVRIKLRDIAERANVSASTVSRVINNHPQVDQQTRETVMIALTQLGYPLFNIKPTNESAMEGVIAVVTRAEKIPTSTSLDEVPPLTNDRFYNDFNLAVTDGIETVIREHGLRLQMERICFEAPDEKDLAQLKQAKGVVIVGGMKEFQLINELEKAGVAFVVAGAHLGEREVNCVVGKYLEGTAKAVAALIELGHTRIALVNGPKTSTTNQDKLTGYKLGLFEANLPYDPELTVTSDTFHPNSCYKATQELLERKQRFTAVIFPDDLMALGGLRAFKEKGLRVPEDVSVIGFYNYAITQFTDPPLSTIHLERQRLGEIAARRLLSILEHSDGEHLQIMLPMRLIMRGSTGPVPG